MTLLFAILTIIIITKTRRSEVTAHSSTSFLFFLFFYIPKIYINSPWANAKSKVHAQQFGNLRRTAQIRGGKQEYKVLE